MSHGQQFPEWRQWLPTLHKEIQLHPGATAIAIESAERQFRIEFPEDLRSVLAASNGVLGRLGCWLVWSVEEIVRQNVELRTMPGIKECYMPFDHLLFIGETGGGDFFGYPIMANGDARYNCSIFRWDHETDNRQWVANTLEQYIVGFTNGTIVA